jgi:uncharacterized membrane-anchored protein
MSDVGDQGAQPRLPRWHSLRDQLYGEPHNRPFPSIPTPARISHIAVLHQPSARPDDLAHIERLCERYGANRPAPDAVCFQQRIGDWELRWEQHLEFSTWTFIQVLVNSGEPFSATALDCLPADWLAGIEGELVCATHLALVAEHELAERDSGRMSSYFEGHALITSLAERDRARLWTAFRLHGDDFGRIIVHNRGMSERRSGRLVQRLLEVETYRLMALLGLPLAKSLAPEMGRMDDELASITRQLAGLDGAEDPSADGARALLDRLANLAASIEARRAVSNYRFAATRAYYDIVTTRLQELRERDIERHLSLREFLTRRLTPAVRTCEAAQRRLDDLANRIDHCSDLLRTRVDLAIEGQNQRLLASMNNRARQQLQLQKTVEGMSIAAISFAVVGLLDIGLKALDQLGHGGFRAVITAVAIPGVLLMVWLLVRRIHKQIGDIGDDG